MKKQIKKKLDLDKELEEVAKKLRPVAEMTSSPASVVNPACSC